MKAISLFSGGLDSILATKLMLEQGVDLEPLHFRLAFCCGVDPENASVDSRQTIKSLGIPLKVIDVSKEMLEIVKHPLHGYGSNMNPCIDCKIFMMRWAKERMEKIGASFLVTGEVLGERPMSQRKDAMFLIEKRADLQGLILRPLSAKLLPPTVPEKEGWVDREKLLNIQGRSRKPQIQLAAHYGIRDYPVPAGGCLLTDPGFARRIKDLLAHHPEFNLPDVYLLKSGRHFRFSPKVKLVVGRNEIENQKIENLAQPGDRIIQVAHHAGPLSLLRGEPEAGEIGRAAAITARYSKARHLMDVEVVCRKVPDEGQQTLTVCPASEEEIKRLIIHE
jgi:tRNA-uridine 2-sulfurtransferase